MRLRPSLVSALLTLAVCGPIGCGGGDDEKPERPATGAMDEAGALSVPGLGRAERIDGFGHSYMAAVGVQPGEGVLPLVASRLRVSGGEEYRGAGVLTDHLTGLYVNHLHRDPGSPPDLGLVMVGLNDIAQYGTDLDGFAKGVETLVSRMRAGSADVHTHQDPTVALGEGGAGWTAAGPVTLVTTEHDLEIDVSGQRDGGTLGFVAAAGQREGGVYRFRVDGEPAGMLDTRGLYPSAPPRPQTVMPFVARVEVPRGAKALHVSITDVAGRAGFFGWHMESRTPPLVVVLRQPRVPDYGLYRGRFHVPDDADVAALNRTIDRAAARFEDGLVVTADAEDEIAADRRFFQPDLLHPNAAGHRELARAAVEAFRAAARR